MIDKCTSCSAHTRANAVAPWLCPGGEDWTLSSRLLRPNPSRHGTSPIHTCELLHAESIQQQRQKNVMRTGMCVMYQKAGSSVPSSRRKPIEPPTDSRHREDQSCTGLISHAESPHNKPQRMGNHRVRSSLGQRSPYTAGHYWPCCCVVEPRRHSVM